MAKVLKNLFHISLILFFIVIFSNPARAEVTAPKIIKLLAQETLSLTGTVPANSEVLIYLDGNFIGRTKGLIDCSAPAVGQTDCQPSWRYQSGFDQKLFDGAHAVMAVAQDLTSLVLSAPTKEIKFFINVVPAPTLIAPNEATATANLRPVITGLAKYNSSVKIFVDGVYNGTTGILKDNSGTANFAYRPALDLSRGWHKIQTQALSDGRISIESNILNFKIELPLPAPTIFKPIINQETSFSRPFIVGLAKNDSKIKIYIDKKYQGELIVKNHFSGTANFAYKPAVALVRGTHLVYTVAVDKRGKESAWSNLVNFSTKNSAIAQSATEENKDAVVKINESQKSLKTKPNPVVISKNSGAVLPETETKLVEAKSPLMIEQKSEAERLNLAGEDEIIKQKLKNIEEADLEKIENLIGTGTVEIKNDRGMINEGKQNQGKLKLDIVLFILFLIGVVAWLFWVNRELVKERRTQTQAEEKIEENKNIQSGQGQKNKLF